MIKFLLHRPVAVIMSWLAVVILGIICYLHTPLSLLPDIPIPNIFIEISAPEKSGDEIENTIVAPILRQLTQVEGFNEVKSTVTNGKAHITLSLEYGINTDYAYLETNERLDAVRSQIPVGATIRTAKANATDMPVMLIQVTEKGSDISRSDRRHVSEIVKNMLRRRLEQLPQVSMVDITGILEPQISIHPDMHRLSQCNITISDLTKALSHVGDGGSTVRFIDGGRVCHLTIDNPLTSVYEVSQTPVFSGNRMYRLSDFAEVTETSVQEEGLSLFNRMPSVAVAVIKNPDANIRDLRTAVDEVLSDMRLIHPELSFDITRDQIYLLDLTIGNLEGSLILGIVLVFLICIVFIKGTAPIIAITLTMIAAIALTFLLFWATNLSINIISVAGLIISVGMMIDNTVIVTENILQKTSLSRIRGCIIGTNEMIVPMLSSILTTIAIFVPMVFLSGISGALFMDQALAIALSLLSSLAAGITLLPVLLSPIKPNKASSPTRAHRVILDMYERGLAWTFRHKKACIISSLIIMGSLPISYRFIERARLPDMHTSDMIMRVDWNENPASSQIQHNIETITEGLDHLIAEQSSFSGNQDFIMDVIRPLSSNQSELYFRTFSKADIATLKDSLSDRIHRLFVNAGFRFSRPDNAFELIFSPDIPPLQANLIYFKDKSFDHTQRLCNKINKELQLNIRTELPEPNIILTFDREAMLRLGIKNHHVTETLRDIFRNFSIATAKHNNKISPIVIRADTTSFTDAIKSAFIRISPEADNGESDKVRYIPLSSIISVRKTSNQPSITDYGAGPVVSLEVTCEDNRIKDIKEKISGIVRADGDASVSFSGTYFSDTEIYKELILVLAVSLVMIYFILCAQFGSFLQPFIVIAEIPIDLSFALLVLWLSGYSLNIMSALGAIAACGIVINDSILKLDAINSLRESGMELGEAIHLAGRRRLNSIVLTSLTTILSMCPLFIFSDMASELQKPFAVTLISAISFGTLISIFLIPLLYYLIYRYKK